MYNIEIINKFTNIQEYGVEIMCPSNNYYTNAYNNFICNVIDTQLLPADTDKVIYKLTKQSIVLLNQDNNSTLMLLDKNREVIKKINIDAIWENFNN